MIGELNTKFANQMTEIRNTQDDNEQTKTLERLNYFKEGFHLTCTRYGICLFFTFLERFE